MLSMNSSRILITKRSTRRPRSTGPLVSLALDRRRILCGLVSREYPGSAICRGC